MIWATVSSWSCFCWLYRAFSIFGCKEYNQSHFGVDHLVMSMCRVFSCVIGRGCLLWPVCSLGKTLLAFALLHFILQGQTCLLFWISLDFHLLHSNPLWWKGHLYFGVSSRWPVGLHRAIQLHLLWHQSGHRLGLLWCWAVCLGNKRRSFCHFEIEPKYCILDSPVEYEGYSICSMGFLPTEVEIMVIWTRFACSHTF